MGSANIRELSLIRGVCDKARLLDLEENFTIFKEGKGANDAPDLVVPTGPQSSRIERYSSHPQLVEQHPQRVDVGTGV